MANDYQNRRGVSSTWPSALVGPVFLLIAGWFLWGPEFVDLPQAVPPAIDRALISTTPPRQALRDPPAIEIDGATRTCMDCHRLFEPADDAPVELILHKGITLNHGINDRCRNCHHLDDRDRLVLHDGTAVSYAQSPSLCAKCHGPTYRDWESGAHGRTNGYWDASAGEVRRLKCSECHDPHNPRVPAMLPVEPLPGPQPPWSHDHAVHGSGEVAASSGGGP